MQFWNIAKKDLLISIRDKSTWFILFLMPVVLILIFTAVFGNNSDDMSFFPAKIVVVNLDEQATGPLNLNLSEQFLQFLHSKDLEHLVTVTVVDSVDEAKKAVSSGKAKAGIVIPGNFNSSFLGQEKARFQILGDAASTIIPGVVKAIVDSYLTILEANRIAMTATSTVAGELRVTPDMQMQMMAELMQKPVIQKLPVNFTEKVEEGKEPVTSAAYYSAGMAVSFLLFAGNLGVFAILEEREQRTLLRLKTSKINKFSLIFGKFLMVLILGIVQLAFLIGFTMLFNKVSWGNSFSGLAFLTIGGVSATSALSVLVASITKTSNTANAVNWIAIQLMSFLGGSYIPLEVMPPVVRALGKLTVNGQALTGYLTLMQGGGMADVLVTGLILFGSAALFLVVGSYFLQFGEEGI